ncbi:MAG: prepilin-type N-terminal cleavage/methylation domain-containing protein, partial [Candidatus Humimicrobiaceae bacterium]
MKWLYRHLHKKEKGFTLVELMVVIIILAVLTGIAIPSYLALRNRARIQATRSEMQNVATALEMYAADNDTYPAAATWNTDIQTGGYMNPVPAVDAWEVGLVFVLVSSSSYSLTSFGPDGVVGGTDNIILTNGQL